jgi:hypothetical protein
VAIRAVPPYLAAPHRFNLPLMDWRTNYESAARRHRELAWAARAAQFPYLAALHERAAELLQAEADVSTWRRQVTHGRV